MVSKIMRSTLLSYSKKRFSAILELSDKLKQEVTVEELHQLRIELKKIRFVVQVLKRYYQKEKVEKAYKPFRHLFNTAGALRSHHVNLYRTNQADTAGEEFEVRHQFMLHEEKFKKKFQKALPHELESVRKAMKSLQKQMRYFPEVDDKAFVYDLAARVFKKLTAHTPKEKLHQSRHLLKVVLYSSELSEDMRMLIEHVFNVEKVTSLEDAIGDWHDLTLLLKSTRRINKFSPVTMEKIESKRDRKLELIYDLIPLMHQPLLHAPVGVDV
jgi:CHAD domain-containing protein